MTEDQILAHAARTGIPLDALKRAFAEERPGAAIEIPDRMDVTYRYSCGELTPFFRALRDEKRFVATKCPRCGRVTLPPRLHCTACRTGCEWVEVGPSGTVIASTTVHFGTSAWGAKPPFSCAYVRLDGCDTAMLASVAAAAPSPGTRVRARFRDVRVGRLDDVEFVPAETATR